MQRTIPAMFLAALLAGACDPAQSDEAAALAADTAAEDAQTIFYAGERFTIDELGEAPPYLVTLANGEVTRTSRRPKRSRPAVTAASMLSRSSTSRRVTRTFGSAASSVSPAGERMVATTFRRRPGRSRSRHHRYSRARRR
jgi:hypothetical protein